MVRPTVNAQELPDWFAGKTLEELDAIEIGRRVMIPEALRRRGAKGDIIEEPVLAQVPTEQERALARVDAIRHVAELRKWRDDPINWTVDRCRDQIGPEVFENIDTHAIVARSLFDRTLVEGKPVQYMMLDVLISSWPPSSIADIYDRLDFYSVLYNPRAGELSEEKFWQCVANIAKVRNISPLGGMRGDLQNAFVARAMSELWRLRMLSLSSGSTEISTPE